MEPSPNGTIDLPGGLILSTGELITTARVRELIGYDEERLSRLDMNKNPAVWVTELLVLAVEEIGTEGKPTKETIRSLLIGDREALVLGIRQTTYGNNVEFKLTCTVCGMESDIAVELDKDVPITEMEDRRARVFDVPLKHGYAKIGLLTGAAQEAFSESIERKTRAEINSIVLAKSVIEINGVQTFGGDDPVRALSSADRTTLVDFIQEHQPGPQLKEIPVPCATCGEEYPILLGLQNLFRF